MAIFHYSVKAINRSSGRSSVAAAAYRAGEKLVDERTGNVYDYERKDGVLHHEIFLPDGETVGREDLWNLVEKAEKRKDAKVAREIVVALPNELSQLDQLGLVRGYAQDLSRRTDWAVDVAMHAPGRDGDQRNTHAHLLCSTRKIERDENGQLRMGAKTRAWDVVSTGKELVLFERQEWERQVNKMLEIAQSPARVDCRSYAAQGKADLMPQAHLGVSACQMERKGVETERGNRNRTAAEHNQGIADLARKRWEREIAQRVAEELNDKRRWEGMTVRELEEERRSIAVGSLRQFAYQEAAVQKACTPLSPGPWYASGPTAGQQRADYEAGKFGWLNEDHLAKKEEIARRASTVRYHAEKDVNQWREAHPYKAALVDMGISNKAYTALVSRYGQASALDEKAKQELDSFQKARRDAEYQKEMAILKAMRTVQAEYDRCKAREAALDKILKPKQEQERALKRERERGRGGRGIGL
jgi:MobA/MobL family